MSWTFGNLLETTVESLGERVVTYGGIPVITSDIVIDAQTHGAATTCSSISGVRSRMEAVTG